ncbi:hypothetical protein BX666DRAFT_2028223 [Dichotomocladium elegans]|nr:hypothetical protein BX666DRAFT_2028223 [Dichotomocladium elegans]
MPVHSKPPASAGATKTKDAGHPSTLELMELKLDIKITCQNSVIKGPGAETVEGHPLRNWKVKLVAMEGVVEKEPYQLQEKGWGEFDMRIILNFVNNVAPTQILVFDLNFRQNNYTVIQTVVFENPSPELQMLFRPSQGGKKRSASAIEKTGSSSSNSSSSNSNSKKARSPLSRSREIDSGASMSPSTPIFHQSNSSIHATTAGGTGSGGGGGGYSSAYSASPQSFASPPPVHHSGSGNGMLASPYDYTQSIKTPQADYDGLTHNYMSDVSDDGRVAIVSGFHSHHSDLSPGSHDVYDHSGENGERNNHCLLPQQNGYSQHRNRQDSSSSEDNGEYSRRGEKTDNDIGGAIVDDVYTESDLDHVNPIHGSELSPETRRAWGIPEAARRLSGMDSERLMEIQDLLEQYRTEEMVVEEREDEVMMDLYSLGPDLLSKLWEHTDQHL